MNIKQNNSGSYFIVVEIGKYTGKVREQKKLTGKTKKEVKDKYLTLINDLENGIFVKPDNATFLSYVEKYLNRKKQQVEESTYKRYERWCRLHIVPALGKMKIQKMNNLVMQRFVDDLANEGFAKKSCQSVLSIMNGIFKIAIKEGVIKENPIFDLELPKAKENQSVVWNLQQIQTFLSIRNEKNRGKYYVAVMMGLLTGMRKGEILGLTWDNVDLDNNLIYVTQILESDGSKISKKTKTGNFRQITIDEMLKEELIKHKLKQKSEKHGNSQNLVFCTWNGLRVIPNTLNDYLDKLSERLGLPRMRFHDTRHTHATLCITELKESVTIVQGRLGHTRPSTTLDRYSHLFPNSQKSIVEKLNKAFHKDSKVEISS
ncbi:tyrosine-type recombinase/integrase [Neobacillus vireti]|uniref:tyrosine-type recombinase/integrase n=1 Tax=Neobacillus vireti TaxID=220686 RepID=UPI003000864F